MDDGFHPASEDSLQESVRIVAGITDEVSAASVREQLLGGYLFVALAGRQRDVDRARFRVDDGVELGRKTSSRAAQSIGFDPPFPPEASWCARMTEPSTIEPVWASRRQPAEPSAAFSYLAFPGSSIRDSP